jgi:hypothetical protein
MVSSMVLLESASESGNEINGLAEPLIIEWE